jgi:uncharacterized protein YegJ (DUF2314 family)
LAKAWGLERQILQYQWEAEKVAMQEAWKTEKAELESKIIKSEAKKMDTFKVLQGVSTKQRTAERSLQWLWGALSTGMSSHPSSS